MVLKDAAKRASPPPTLSATQPDPLHILFHQCLIFWLASSVLLDRCHCLCRGRCRNQTLTTSHNQLHRAYIPIWAVGCGRCGVCTPIASVSFLCSTLNFLRCCSTPTPTAVKRVASHGTAPRVIAQLDKILPKHKQQDTSNQLSHKKTWSTKRQARS